MDACPLLVQECLKKWFLYPAEMVHAQVATASGMPHVRTMGLYEMTDEGALVFLTRNDTLKWVDMKHNPFASVCFVNLEYGQLVASGPVDLKTRHESSACLKYWKAMAPSIRKIYLPYNSDEISDSFGVMLVKPTSWEVLQINKEDFCSSVRKLFLLSQNSWQESDLIPV